MPPPCRWRLARWLALLILALAPPAWANMGTPLMWAGLLQATVGNFLIGAVEAITLRIAFRLPYSRGLVLMTLANYATMVLGWLLLKVSGYSLQSLMPPEQLLRFLPVLLHIAIAGLFVSTVLAEAPFVYRLFPLDARQWRKAFKGSLLAQTVSTLMLVPLYLSASNYSLITQAKIQPDLRFVHAPPAMVYYIGSDGDIWRIRTDGAGRTKLLDANLRGWVGLFLKRSPDGKTWQLWMEKGRQKRKLLDSIIAPPLPGEKKQDLIAPRDFGRAVDWRPPESRECKVWTDVWAAWGLYVDCEDRKRSYSLGIETPLIAWTSRYATVLPGDYAVYQLDGQIVVLHLPTKRIGFLTRGSNPVVVPLESGQVSQR